MVVVGPRDESMRMARMYYDNIAGRLGLAIAESLLADQAIVFDGEGGRVTGRAGEVLLRWGLPLEAGPQHPSRGRPYCRPSLDWSERKAHLAGRLGAMICTHCLDRGIHAQVKARTYRSLRESSPFRRLRPKRGVSDTPP